MTNLELHKQVYLGLQNINVFQYADIQMDEFDLFLMNTVYDLIQKVFRPSDRPPKEQRELEQIYDKFQFTQDEFKVLKIKGPVTSVSSFDRGVFSVLPTDYLHLLNDRSIVSIQCHENGVEVTKTKEVPNRLMETENLYTILENPFETTNIDSPISELEGNNIRVYTENNFTVIGTKIDYCRQPRVIDTVNNPNQQLEFPEQTARRIAEYCIVYLAKITEQSQQKIVNLESEK